MLYPHIIRYLLVLGFASLITSTVLAEETALERGKMLLATELLDQGEFSHSVIYITENNAGGTFGLIINRPTPFPVNEVVPNQTDKTKVFFGGPMHTQFMFLLAEGKLTVDSPLHKVKDDIYFGAGTDNLSKLHADPSAQHIRTFAGFASWGPGQLQVEINNGFWIEVPATVNDIFSENPDDLWSKLIKQWSGDWT